MVFRNFEEFIKEFREKGKRESEKNTLLLELKRSMESNLINLPKNLIPIVDIIVELWKKGDSGIQFKLLEVISNSRCKVNYKVK